MVFGGSHTEECGNVAECVCDVCKYMWGGHNFIKVFCLMLFGKKISKKMLSKGIFSSGIKFEKGPFLIRMEEFS